MPQTMQNTNLQLVTNIFPLGLGIGLSGKALYKFELVFYEPVDTEVITCGCGLGSHVMSHPMPLFDAEVQGQVF